MWRRFVGTVCLGGFWCLTRAGGLRSPLSSVFCEENARRRSAVTVFFPYPGLALPLIRKRYFSLRCTSFHFNRRLGGFLPGHGPKFRYVEAFLPVSALCVLDFPFDPFLLGAFPGELPIGRRYYTPLPFVFCQFFNPLYSPVPVFFHRKLGFLLFSSSRGFPLGLFLRDPPLRVRPAPLRRDGSHAEDPFSARIPHQEPVVL